MGLVEPLLEYYNVSDNKYKQGKGCKESCQLCQHLGALFRGKQSSWRMWVKTCNSHNSMHQFWHVMNAMCPFCTSCCLKVTHMTPLPLDVTTLVVYNSSVFCAKNPSDICHSTFQKLHPLSPSLAHGLYHNYIMQCNVISSNSGLVKKTHPLTMYSMLAAGGNTFPRTLLW